MNGEDMTQYKEEEERRKNKMKEKERQRNWDPAWGNQMRIQILGDSNLIVKLDERKVEDQLSKIQDDDTKDTGYDGQDRHQADGRSLGHVSSHLQRVESGGRQTHTCCERKRSNIELLYC